MQKTEGRYVGDAAGRAQVGEAEGEIWGPFFLETYRKQYPGEMGKKA